MEDCVWHLYCRATVMMASKSGFQAKVKEKAPHVRGIRCIIHVHRYALDCTTLKSTLKETLESTIVVVTYVKPTPLDTLLFKKVCSDISADHVRW